MDSVTVRHEVEITGAFRYVMPLIIGEAQEACKKAGADIADMEALLYGGNGSGEFESGGKRYRYAWGGFTIQRIDSNAKQSDRAEVSQRTEKKHYRKNS